MSVTPLPDGVLPQRPRLVAGIEIYHRSDHEVQFGLDPRHAVVAQHLPAALIKLIGTLDGTVPLPDLITKAGPEHAPILVKLISELAACGLLTDAARPARRSTPSKDRPGATWTLYNRERRAALADTTVVVDGHGPLLAAVSALLAASGVGRIIPRSSGTVTGDDVGAGFDPRDVGRSRRHAAAAIIRAANPTVSTDTLRHERRPDLVILTDAVVPERQLVRELNSDGQAHLPVNVREGIGVLGPLVVPGFTSCLWCADLHRTDLDPDWPRVANQLAGRHHRADPATMQATAAFAVGQLVHTLRPGSTPQLWNASMELDLHTGKIQHRNWLPHPRCECGAAHLGIAA